MHNDEMIRRAIGGNDDAIAWIGAQAATSDDSTVVAMAALIAADPAQLERARDLATSSRDRQVVAITTAHLGGRRDLVDALARDHLVDFPDSLIVAWIAAESSGPSTGPSTGPTSGPNT